MTREKRDMSLEWNRRSAQEDGLAQARLYVMDGHPHIPHEEAEIREVGEHLLALRLQEIEPNDEWLYRDIFLRNFIGKYKELLARMDKEKQVHDELKRKSLMPIHERLAESPLHNLPDYSKKKKGKQ